MIHSQDIINALFSIRKQDLDGFYAAMPKLQEISQIPQIILYNAIETYAPNCKPEDAVVLIDLSTASNGRSGMIFTKQGLYCSMMRFDVFTKQKIEQPILYENIKLAEVHSDNVHIIFKSGFSQTVYGGKYTEFITLALNKLRKLTQSYPSSKESVLPNNKYTKSFSNFNYKKELELEKEKLQENYNKKIEAEMYRLENEFSEKLQQEKTLLENQFSEKLQQEKTRLKNQFSEKLQQEKTRLENQFSEKLKHEKALLEKEKEEQVALYKKITSRRSLVSLNFSDFVKR